MARRLDERPARAALGPRTRPVGSGVSGDGRLTPRRAGWLAGIALLACYLLTSAPGVTFWDAGELIAAASGFGIPHPPGTPLYVAVGHLWTMALAPVTSAARAMNLLSAGCTAAAGSLTAWLIAREARARIDAAWGAIAGALCAGLMATAWSNATETEVYAAALFHVVLLLACAARAGQRGGNSGRRWVACTAYLMSLAPAMHLTVLVAAPAAIVLAARTPAGRWNVQRSLLLGGVLVAAAGVGRMSEWIVGAGAMLIVASVVFPRRGATAGEPGWRDALLLSSLVAIAASALLIMLVRARHDPPLNQGNPSTLAALSDVVARRQYDVAPMLPRQAPVWLQLANVAQYVDWQVALGWGHGIFTTPARVAATLVFVALALAGARALRRDAIRLADALIVLALCGTLGVAAYLNLKAGSSLGWGVLPDSAPHEARERDYFFVLGFWAWGCLAGYGALGLVRRWRWPAPAAIAVSVVPLLGNWSVSDRSVQPRGGAARDVAAALLESAPRDAVLFLAGDNDSYPLWYLQQVEGRRTDVSLITLSLLPARWYEDELLRRTGLRAEGQPAKPSHWQHERLASQLANAARAAGKPVTASPALTATERALLGGAWRLEGVVYRSWAEGTGTVEAAAVDTSAARAWMERAPEPARSRSDLVDDVSARMLEYLACPRLRSPATPHRDSLEVKCNLR